MYIIIEWNGRLPEGFIGAVLTPFGNPEMFKTKEDAESFAETECSFNYRIVEL